MALAGAVQAVALAVAAVAVVQVPVAGEAVALAVAAVAGVQVPVAEEAVALAAAEVEEVEKEFRLHRPLKIAHGVTVKFWDRRHLGTAVDPRCLQ